MTPLFGRGPSGTWDILRLALPLILSHGSWMVQQIVDRIFLSWLSPEAVAAGIPH
jgi:MATE family multidrug resistance protein